MVFHSDLSCPKLFVAQFENTDPSAVATVTTTTVYSDLAVCQPYIDPAFITTPDVASMSEVCEALSHLSLEHTSMNILLTNFKGKPF